MDKKTDRVYLYINSRYINSLDGADIKLTIRQKIKILFSKGIRIVLKDK